MSDKSRKRPFFPKEKADLLKRTLGQFDQEITVNPLTLEKDIDPTSIKDRTFLFQVLLETLCSILEKDLDKRKELFKRLYKGFLENEVFESVMDANIFLDMRRSAALRFYNHVKEVHESICPHSIEQTYEQQEISIPISVQKYDETFDEIQIIAHGGFGVVCKARHRMDGLIYAVKKIIFNYRKDSDYIKVMGEVRNLAGLSSKYVVAYNNTWVQAVEPCDLDSEESDSEIDFTEDETVDNRSTFDQSRIASNSEDSLVVFENSNGCLNENSKAQSNSNTSQNKSVCSSSSSKQEESPSKNSMLKIKMMLCIQMEYCDYDLRHWLDVRNEGGILPFTKSVPDIFKEILCGVVYIHDKNIIHRDLKPQNIFFSNDKGVMKLGDFGLATLNRTPTNGGLGNESHSTNLGTLPYAAPEQRNSSVYDSKVDMYSLGIILIELLVKVGTKMEFFKILEDFRGGIIPKEIEQEWPEYIPLLDNLLHEDHNSRKSAKEVLDMPLFKHKITEVGNLERTVKDLEQELVLKKQEIQEREQVLTQRFLKQELEFQERERALTQRFLKQELEFQERERALTQKFQDQEQKFVQRSRTLEEALTNKECLLQQIAEEVKLLKETINRFT